MQPTISVVIPVFNASSTLEMALKSVIQQSINTEIIVVDGGSTDGSIDIVQQYSKHIASFVTGPDKGVYDAMNKGFAMSKGIFVYFLGADDRLHDPHVFSRLLADVEHADLFTGIVHQMPPRHSRIKEWNHPEWNWTLNLRHTLHHQGVVYKRDKLPKVPFDIRFKILADYALHLDLYRKGVTIKVTDVHIADCGSEGISKNFNIGLYKEEWQLKKEVLPFFWRLFHLIWLPLKFLYKKF